MAGDICCLIPIGVLSAHLKTLLPGYKTPNDTVSSINHIRFCAMGALVAITCNANLFAKLQFEREPQPIIAYVQSEVSREF